MIAKARCLLNIAALMFAATIALEAVHFMTLKYFRDVSYWIWYDAIDAEKPVNSNNSDLWMVSMLSVHRSGVDVEWTDVLRCRPWGVEQVPYGFQSMQKTGASNPSIGNNKISRWLYAENLPRYDAECYIDSTINVVVNEFIKHPQKIDSSTFRVIPAP